MLFVNDKLRSQLGIALLYDLDLLKHHNSADDSLHIEGVSYCNYLHGSLNIGLQFVNAHQELDSNYYELEMQPVSIPGRLYGIVHMK